MSLLSGPLPGQTPRVGSGRGSVLRVGALALSPLSRKAPPVFLRRAWLQVCSDAAHSGEGAALCL